MLAIGDHSVACFALAITASPEGFLVHTEGHGSGLLLRQAVRDWLAAADAMALQDHLEEEDGGDDDAPGEGGTAVPAGT